MVSYFQYLNNQESINKLFSFKENRCEYMLPFEEEVGLNPKLDEMKQLVVDNSQRPLIQKEWLNHHVYYFFSNANLIKNTNHLHGVYFRTYGLLRRRSTSAGTLIKTPGYPPSALCRGCAKSIKPCE
jgi:hypothetical protein